MLMILFLLVRKNGFEMVSGLKVNFHKSIGANVDDMFLSGASCFLNCVIGHILFRFLDLPIGANPRRVEMWRPIIEMMRKKFAGWKGRNLSLGGRIVLVNSVFSSLSLYFFSLFIEFQRKCLVKWCKFRGPFYGPV